MEHESWQDHIKAGDADAEPAAEPALEERLKALGRAELEDMLSKQDEAIAAANRMQAADPPSENAPSKGIQLREARDKIKAALDRLPGNA